METQDGNLAQGRDLDDLESAIFRAICYYRYRGITLAQLDQFGQIRLQVKDFRAQRRAALERLSELAMIEKRGGKWYVHPLRFKSVRGDALRPAFAELDFAILMVIAGGREACDLDRIVSTFDFIVRTLPSFEELYGALNRLWAARLITSRAGTYKPTRRARVLFKTAKRTSPESTYDVLSNLQHLVLCPTCGPALRRVEWDIELTPSEFRSALRRYKEGRPPLVEEG